MTAAAIIGALTSSTTTGLLGATEDGPHISLSAEPIFTIAGITITNSLIYGALCALLFAGLTIYAAKKVRVKARGGIAQFIEMAVEFVIGLVEPALGSRKKAIQYAPIFAMFFLFIIFNNLMGLLPLVGPGVYAETAQGHTPLFRPFTADLNGTLALGIIAIVTVQILSIRESGFLGHLKHYFTDKPFNPINMFIGLLEVFGELTRILSLSLRLFLNTAVGEILISVFAYVGQNFQSFTILPIAVFEMLVAGIQAYVFTMLCATYLGLAIAHGEHHEESDHAHSSPSSVKTAEVTG